jgi:peptide/nickel transport system permease protein
MRPLLRIIVGVFVTAVISSFVIFASLLLAPGDPVRFLTAGRSLDPRALAALRAEYHLDDPFFQRYWLWVTGVVHGDFGSSIVFHEPVSQLITPRIATTVLLVGLASLLIIVGGVLLGVLAALAPTKAYRPLSAVLTTGLATPTFVLAIILITLFAAHLHWFPVFGAGSSFGDRLYHMCLPAVALAVSGSVYVARVTDVSVRAEFGREHVETARSRGLSEASILRRHVLRNALIPITTVSGVTIASLLAGTVIVETAFGLNGLGSLLVQSVTEKDFAVVQAICLILVVGFIVINGVCDALYALIDPRVRRPRR